MLKNWGILLSRLKKSGISISPCSEGYRMVQLMENLRISDDVNGENVGVNDDINYNNNSSRMSVFAKEWIAMNFPLLYMRFI